MRHIGLAILLATPWIGCGDDDDDTTRDSGTEQDSGTGPDSGLDAGADTGTGDMGAPALRGVTLDMTGMTPHVGQRMEFRVVDDSDVLVAHGVLESLPAAAYAFPLPNSTPEGSGYRLDFYADLSGNDDYDAPPTDHAWRVDTIPATGDANLDFAHNTTFTDIDSPAVTPLGMDFALNLTGMTPHVDQLVEVRVLVQETGRVVGRYVAPSLAGAAVTIAVPGIIEDGVDYQVDFYADLSGNGQYDAPPTDHAWRLTGTGTASGLTLDFAHNTTFTDVGF